MSARSGEKTVKVDAVKGSEPNPVKSFAKEVSEGFCGWESERNSQRSFYFQEFVWIVMNVGKDKRKEKKKEKKKEEKRGE